MLCWESLTITSADVGTEELDFSGLTYESPASEPPLGLQVYSHWPEVAFDICLRVDLVCTYVRSASGAS